MRFNQRTSEYPGNLSFIFYRDTKVEVDTGHQCDFSRFDMEWIVIQDSYRCVRMFQDFVVRALPSSFHRSNAGQIALRPPEYPAIKCGSISPVTILHRIQGTSYQCGQVFRCASILSICVPQVR